MMKKIIYIVLFLLNNTTYAQTESEKYQLDTIFEAEGIIWSFAFISQNESLITMKNGTLFYFNSKTKEKKELQTPNVSVTGQGGLLDIHYYRYAEIQNVFLTFTERVGTTVTTSLARAEYKNKTLKNLTTIFRAKVRSNTGRHFGSRLAFKGQYIYMTIGDRGERKYAQQLEYHNGSILRLTLDGEAAQGNPFENTENALAEIWSMGHRNPQGIAIDPVTGKIYSSEFGPRGGDELNLIEKGKNYGWPLITYGREYYGPSIGTTHRAGLEQPVTYWVPSISPSGMAFYTGDKIPKWKNNLFLASLGARHLRRLVLIKNKVIKQEVLFEMKNERIRHVRTGLDGYLYFSTDSGKLIKVSARNN